MNFADSLLKHTNRMTDFLKTISIPLSQAHAKHNLPSTGGVYRLFFTDEPNVTLYVGKSKDLRKRICGDLLAGDEKSHTFRGKLGEAYTLGDKEQARRFLEQNIECQVMELGDETQRRFFEHFAIAVLEPHMNDEGRLD